VGANGLWFFFLCGLAVSASATAMRGGNVPSKLPLVRSPTVKSLAVVGALILTVAVIGYNLSTLSARFYYSHIQDTQIDSETPTEDLHRHKQIAGYASRFDPLNADYSYAMANATQYLNGEASALGDLSRSVRLNPTNSDYLNHLGTILAFQGQSESANRLLSAAVENDAIDAEYAFRYGAWLLTEGQTSRGLSYLRRAVELDIDKIDAVLVNMAIYRVSDADMPKAIPEVPEAAIAYADYLYSSGKTREAEAQYSAALSYLEKQEKIRKSSFYRILSFYKKRGDTTGAVRVMLRASELLPADPGVRITLGDLYRDMGITYRAEEEYQHALLISPGNKNAQRRLEKLKTVSP
jgi:tetratricopeptide (TPR) repeat protein